MSDPTRDFGRPERVPDLKRPLPADPGVAERLRLNWNRRRETWRNQIESQRQRRRVARASDTVGEIGVDPAAHLSIGAERSGIFTALVAAGAAMLALGSLWAWQSWSQRSAEPIDDLLPILSTSDADLAAPISTAEPSEPVETSADSNARETISGQPRALSEPEAEPSGQQTIVVHVSGSVRDPGVVELEVGSRVFEAVSAAGGADVHADLDRVNLAAPLADGERIHLPRIGQDELPVVVQPERPLTTTPSAELGPPELATVDINTAGAQALQALPGVGPSLAQAIIRTREARGPFLQIEELLDVPGIGEAKLAAMASLAVVIPPPR